MRCPSCEHENREGRRFCAECGARLVLACAGCGGANEPGEKFCGACGAPLVVDQPAAQAAAVPGAPPLTPAADGERRQLTVLFCDLADSTMLSGRLDPEELRELVRAYQQACAAVIARYEGHVAQYLGDGILAYFGYPAAHEDDARRAAAAALEIVAAMRDLNARLAQPTALAVRVGIHTGLVVVGEMGSAGRTERLALGETPNLAARLQGLAAPDTVVISAATHRLVAGYAECLGLGPQLLKGIPRPVVVYRVEAMTGAGGRLDVAPALTPLVGREQELALIEDRWQRAAGGRFQAVVLSGEAGIGKSRLVRVLRERLDAAATPPTRIELRCAQIHEHSALYPLIDHLQRVLGTYQSVAQGAAREHIGEEDVNEVRLVALEDALGAVGLPLAETVPLFAALLSLPLPARYPALNLSPERQKQRTFEAVLAWLRAEAVRRPVLLVVEDLHWIDPSTLELLDLLLERAPAAPLLAVLTCRPEFAPPWPPEAHLGLLTLARFGREEATECIRRVAGGKALPAEVLAQIAARTDGVPLFVEELTKMVLESGLLVERDGAYVLTGPLPPLAIPATLHDSLMARLDRLAAVKDVAQLGAALGREFGYELLQAVAGLDDGALQTALVQLAQAGLIYPRGVPPSARYVFKHALIQDAAYQSLLRSRRQQLHQQTARTLEARFPEVVEMQPELLAHHYTEAGLVEPAVLWWQRAGERAAARSANQEAVAHLTRALQLLNGLPDAAEHGQQELDVLLALGQVLIALKGWAAPEIEPIYARAWALCQQLEVTPQRLPTVYGLTAFRIIRAQMPAAMELAEEHLRLAEAQPDPVHLVTASTNLHLAHFWLGDFPASRRWSERALALYEPGQHAAHIAAYGVDNGVTGRSFQAIAAWILGYPDQAWETMTDTLAVARAHAHPLTLVWVLTCAAMLAIMRREEGRAGDLAEEAVRFAERHEQWLYLAWVTGCRGWVWSAQGRGDDGIAALRESLTAYQSLGSRHAHACWCAWLAEAYLTAGQAAEAAAVIDDALAVVEDGGQRFWGAELYRLRGQVRLADDQDAAERDYRHAIAIARAQEARSLELRAATSLARLWQAQGKKDAARELLAPVYGWFTEGFDTRDLREAKALLDELQ